MSSKLNVMNALKNPGQSYPFTADTELEEMTVLGDPVRFENVTAEGTLIGTDETVVSFEIKTKATVHSLCARCRDDVTMTIEAQMKADYARQPDPDDPDQYLFEGSTVDLKDAIKDALLLELPLRFLCKEDCKGLCPMCGANLNTGSCHCRREVEDNPFAVLRSIVDYNEEV